MYPTLGVISGRLLIVAAFAALLLFAGAWLAWPDRTGFSHAAVLAVGFGCLLAAVIGIVRSRRDRRYDLGALRDLHEQGGPAPSPDEIPDVAPDATVYCRSCGSVYDARFPICPNCGQ